MAVYIWQEDALDLMTEVEGETWRRRQAEGKFGGTSFQAFLDAWRRMEAATTPEERERYKEDNISGPDGDGAIYGDCGWNRYAVGYDGELRFILAQSGSREDTERARRVGFRIW